MENIIDKVREALQNKVDEKALAGSQHFFKEKIKCYGVRAPMVRQIGKEFFKMIKDRSKSEIFDLCEDLWRSGFIEESFVACHWSYFIRAKFEPSDFARFEKWIDDYIDNWASCDTFCNHTMGTFIAMYPEFLTRLKVFGRSENRWKRRAAAVSLIVPARTGKFLGDIFDIADILLIDTDDLVQKGYGWMLKAASKVHQREVFDYVIKNKDRMPRTALRYAIEKMPKDLKTIAMAK
tara:strand:+ start:893 stop:1600 length:708 start_codon:yes stop_codon:yes gene_type:complete